MPWYINIAIAILEISHYSVFYLKHNISVTGFCLRIQVEPTQLDTVDRTSPCLWTMDNFRNCNSYNLSCGAFKNYERTY
jgi:hypothetical protein